MDKSKFCQDPMGKHKKRIHSNIRPVSEFLSSLVKGKIKINSHLCNNCITAIHKDPEIFLNQFGNPSKEISDIDDIESVSSICTSSTDIDMAEVSEVNFESMLASCDVSPIKTSKKQDI